MLRVAATSTWFLLSLAGFGLSLVVHTTAFFGISVTDRLPITMILHLGMFVVVLPLLLVVSSRKRTKSGQGRWGELFQRHPPWVLGLLYALLAYAVVNFAVGFLSSRGGVPTIVDGQPVLKSHDRVIRQLSQEEYERHQALETRAFSGLWLFFYGIPLLYLGFGRSEKNPERAA